MTPTPFSPPHFWRCDPDRKRFGALWQSLIGPRRELRAIDNTSVDSLVNPLVAAGGGTQ